MIPDDRIAALVSELCRLTSLSLATSPRVVINSRSAPRRLIGQVVQHGLAPEQIPGDLQWLVQGEGDCQRDDSVHVLDLLGAYEPESNNVVLYDLLIRLAAIKLDIPHDELRLIVLGHELAHAVTHRGLDDTGEEWRHFDAAPSADKELVAQLFAHVLFQQDRPALAAAMDRLAVDQPEIYQSYRQHVARPQCELQSLLRAIRRKVPAGLEQFARASSTPWSIEFSNLADYKRPRRVMVAWHPGFRDEDYLERVREGTHFILSMNRLVVRSHDYKPSGTRLSSAGSCRAFTLLLEHRPDIDAAAVPVADDIPWLRVTLDGTTRQLDLAHPPALAVYDGACSVIGTEHPVLERLLRSYCLAP